MVKKFLLVIFLAIPLGLWAQIGGRGVFSFLNLSPSARSTGLGTNQISIRDYDLALAYSNPSLLNKQMGQTVVLNYIPIFAGINMGYAAYGWQSTKGPWQAGLMYINYGKFDGYDETGASTGQFNASDYAFVAGHSREIGNNFNIGANAKFILSQYENFTSTGIALDLGTTWADTSGLTAASFLIRNIGTQLTTYDGVRENLPIELMAGITHKLRYAPFRLGMVIHNIQTPDISYINTNSREQRINIETGEPEEQRISVGDKIFRHVILSTELVFGKGFQLRFAYNHQRRQELRLPDRGGFAGFSWGFGIRIAKIKLDYAMAGFIPGRNLNQFTLSIKPADFKKKKNTNPSPK